jgi:hypothetical protein
MLLRKYLFIILLCSAVPVVLSLTNAPDKPAAFSITENFGDTTPVRLPYPISDRRGDVLSNKYRSTYDLQQPSNISDSVVYDAITRRYTVYEKIGSRYYRTPTTYNFDEYWQMRNKQAEVEYFQKGQIPQVY